MTRMFRLLLATTAVVSGPAVAQDLISDGPLQIDEWRVPYEESRPRDPYAASGDTVWFVGQRTGYLAKLDVTSGDMSKVDLPEGEGPHNLIVSEDGIVWYAGNRTGVIGRYDPETDELEEIPMPEEAARDPHTLIFNDDQSAIFFTVQGGNYMGRLDIDTREVNLVPSKTEGSRPYGIKQGPDGTVWVALFGTSKLARLDPETLELTEVPLPRDAARPRRLEVGEDGRVWYVDYAEGRLGVYDPEAEEFEEWTMPSGEGARPYGTAMDEDGTIWFVETGVEPNMFRGFDPETEEFIAGTAVPSGGGTVRHMFYHQPEGTVWFGADTNTVGRALVGEVE